MIDQQHASPTATRPAATVAHDGGGHACSRADCDRPAPLRVAVLFLVWWSCSRHLDDLLDLIQEHGFAVTYSQAPISRSTTNRFS
ncbi:hypothetical protein AB0K60_27790 [Thermopolyspora sp. NPDC052614]|uniref:hypothetical protein n=1 Tax=Thermopolyspora sp. NPDC052614 TaxID=3155682 RepID=UPI00341E071F